jgi:PPK2 family polyphosphate:nucleotide phosphotransferase
VTEPDPEPARSGVHPVPAADGLVVEPGAPAGLGKRDPGDRLGFEDRAVAEQESAALTERMAHLQGRLWAEKSRAVLLVLQGVDASGKDGAIRRVFTGVNPQGCDVHAFRQPTETELAYDFLWRVHAVCPRRGEIGVFNRSHYEDVVVTWVDGDVDDDRRASRFRSIREFERMLVEEGTEVLKCFLHVSLEEQAERLRARWDDPEKRWKLTAADLEASARWERHMEAYEAAVSATSTAWAPWYVVPADRKWVRDVAVGRLVAGALERMDPQLPAGEDLGGFHGR